MLHERVEVSVAVNNHEIQRGRGQVLKFSIRRLHFNSWHALYDSNWLVGCITCFPKGSSRGDYS